MLNSIISLTFNKTIACVYQIGGACRNKAAQIALKIKSVVSRFFTSISQFFFTRLSKSSKMNTKTAAVTVQKTAQTASAIFVFGSPGAGKNSFVDKFCAGDKFRSYTLIDADLEMEKISGYQQAVQQGDAQAAERFHNEALKRRNQLFSETKKDKKNLIYVGSGAHLDFYKKVITSLKTDYHINTVFIEIDLQLAVQRAKTRADLTGRVVPEKVIRDNFTQANLNFHSLKQLADSWEVYNNDHHMVLKESG